MKSYSRFVREINDIKRWFHTTIYSYKTTTSNLSERLNNNENIEQNVNDAFILTHKLLNEGFTIRPNLFSFKPMNNGGTNKQETKRANKIAVLMREEMCCWSFCEIAVERSGISAILRAPINVIGIKSSGIVIPIAMPYKLIAWLDV